MTIEEWVGPAAMTVLVSIVGYLLSRSIAQLDTKVSRTSDSVEAIKLEISGYTQLFEYQEKRIAQLESKNESLHHAVGAFDKFIAVQVALGKVHPIGQEQIGKN